MPGTSPYPSATLSCSAVYVAAARSCCSKTSKLARSVSKIHNAVRSSLDWYLERTFVGNACMTELEEAPPYVGPEQLTYIAATLLSSRRW